MTALLLLLACAQAPPSAFVAEHARAFGVDASHHGPTHPGFKRTSLYLPMRDGVRLAADLILPHPLEREEKVPAILSVTPYWRSREGDEPGPLPRFFATHGMTMVVADERGTGASFGLWRHPWTPESITDIGDLVAWIAAQAWSNGRVGAIGDSYVGTTAQLAAAAGRPEVRAVVPRFMETDVYDDVAYPGGLYAKWLIETWTDLVRGLSLGIFPGPAPTPRIRPVDGPDGPALLARALEEHRKAPPFDMRGAIFREDRAPASKVSWDDFSVHRQQEAIERSGAAIYGWGSWLDGRTADAVLRRFMTFKNPQRAIIGAWSHGGRLHVSPFARADSEVLGPEAQALEHLRFFEHHLRGAPAPELDRREIVYFTLGAERWQRTDRWPPPGFADERLYLAADGHLVRAVPPADALGDRYKVDFTATTGPRSRWHTELDGGPVTYGDRTDADQSLLTYTSDPLGEDVEITGHPRARLWVRSTAEDAAFHVYLESVDTQGRVTHLVEGQLRGRDRRTSSAPYASFGPYHSHTRGNAAAMPANETVALDFALYPVSVCVPRGHRLRVALAGADAGLFKRVPPEGDVTITVERNRHHPSAVDLPTKRGVTCQGQQHAERTTAPRSGARRR